MANPEFVIEQTQQWIKQVVIGHNLCPFAKQPFEKNTIGYIVSDVATLEFALSALAEAAFNLSSQKPYETSLLIFESGFADFDGFLDLIALADQLLIDLMLSDELLLAHFHPNYCFEGEASDDAANYSNRSVYPMLHLLKQSSVTMASQSTVDLDAIPDKNIQTLRNIGVSALSSSLSKFSK
ncbi:MAG: hypothetical protein ACI9J2_001277 [Saprospiraceae bacterium]|jgi:hypothetical protein